MAKLTWAEILEDCRRGQSFSEEGNITEAIGLIEEILDALDALVFALNENDMAPLANRAAILRGVAEWLKGDIAKWPQ